MDDDHQSRYKLISEVSKTLNLLNEDKINTILRAIANEAQAKMHYILTENQKDIQRIGLDNPKYDCLLLTEERLMNIISRINHIASLSSPIGQELGDKDLRNGLKLTKFTVPFGVIGVILETSPDESFDMFSLCFKSGNACILKGGSDAHYTNSAIVEIIRYVLDNNGVNPNICTLLPNDRHSTEELLNAREYVNLVISRDDENLINFVKENSKIPHTNTCEGVCHTYFHKKGDKEKGQKAILNAKTTKVNASNTLDCLLIDKDRLDDLYYLCEQLSTKNVEIYADKLSYEALAKDYPKKLLHHADDGCFETEFEDYKMAVKAVWGIDDAIQHIGDYSSKHSEAIISEDKSAIDKFNKLVNATCIYSNISTALIDEMHFDLEEKAGIAIPKIHTSGSIELAELCTYKWLIEKNGQMKNEKKEEKQNA